MSGPSIEMHDPMTVWYALTCERQYDQWQIKRGEDIRVETAGQWTRGMVGVDRRDFRKQGDVVDSDDNDEGHEAPGDHGGWLSTSLGNRVGRCVGTPGENELSRILLQKIFGT